MPTSLIQETPRKTATTQDDVPPSSCSSTRRAGAVDLGASGLLAVELDVADATAADDRQLVALLGAQNSGTHFACQIEGGSQRTRCFLRINGEGIASETDELTPTWAKRRAARSRLPNSAQTVSAAHNGTTFMEVTDFPEPKFTRASVGAGPLRARSFSGHARRVDVDPALAGRRRRSQRGPPPLQASGFDRGAIQAPPRQRPKSGPEPLLLGCAAAAIAYHIAGAPTATPDLDAG